MYNNEEQNKGQYEDIAEQNFILYDDSLKFLLCYYLNHLNKNNLENKDDFDKALEVGWEILCINHIIMSRENIFNYKHLKIIVISFGLYIINDILDTVQSDPNSIKYKKILSLLFPVLSVLAHTHEEKINYQEKIY